MHLIFDIDFARSLSWSILLCVSCVVLYFLSRFLYAIVQIRASNKSSYEELEKLISSVRKTGDKELVEELEELRRAADLARKDDSQTAGQKVCMVLLFLGFAGFFFVMFSHSFVPSEAVKKVSSYLSLFLTMISVVALFGASKEHGGIGNSPGFKDLSLLKKVFVYPLCPVIIYGYFWINFGMAIPRLANDVIGTSSVNIEIAKKGEDLEGICGGSLNFSSMSTIDEFFFKYYLSTISYASLPDSPVEVTVHTKQSYFGAYVQSVEIQGRPLYRCNW